VSKLVLESEHLRSGDDSEKRKRNEDATRSVSMAAKTATEKENSPRSDDEEGSLDISDGQVVEKERGVGGRSWKRERRKARKEKVSSARLDCENRVQGRPRAHHRRRRVRRSTCQGRPVSRRRRSKFSSRAKHRIRRERKGNEQ